MSFLNKITELQFSDEAKEVVAVVERFAQEVMRPIGIELDAMANPDDVIAPNSPLWKVHEKYRQLGIPDIASSTDFELRERVLLGTVVSEIMGWGDAGLSISLGVAFSPRRWAQNSEHESIRNTYGGADYDYFGCWAITESNHGSDSLGFNLPAWKRSDIRADCIAQLDGDEWVINGSKSAWVSNGPIANLAALFCTIDGDEGFAGGGIFVVPLDVKGVSKGKNLPKLGQRSLPQGEIFFDNVRVPKESLITQKSEYTSYVDGQLTGANAGMGSSFAGLARAAFDLALDYAKERVQGGVPIIEHQHVQARLLKMHMAVEAATSLSRRVRLLTAFGEGSIQMSASSKVFCTQTAFDVASEAIQIFGGNGLTEEYPIEKIFRDARSSMIEDGCNELLSIVGGAAL